MKRKSEETQRQNKKAKTVTEENNNKAERKGSDFEFESDSDSEIDFDLIDGDEYQDEEMEEIEKNDKSEEEEEEEIEMEKKDEFFRTKLTEEDKKEIMREVPNEHYLTKDIQFMFLKSEYDFFKSDKYRKNKEVSSNLYFDIFGVTEEGYDIRCMVNGFEPYFYVEIDNSLYEDGINQFKKSLLNKIEDQEVRSIKELNFITNIKKTKKKSVYHFSKQEKHFFKVFTGHPQYVSKLRSILEAGLTIKEFGNYKFLTYESNVAFHIRCMLDKNIRGSSWLEVKKDNYHVVKKKQSHCSIEIEVDIKDLIVHEPDDNWSKIAPIRLLSYDIEALGENHFPNAELGDKVICISCIIEDTNKKEKKNYIMALEDTSQTKDCKTWWFETESDLLMGFKDFVIASNPDFLTGYNISKFDNSYLFKRAKELKLNNFAKLSKLKNKNCVLKSSKTYSAQSGAKESENAAIYGRTNFDMYPIIVSTFKYDDYSLNVVSKELLKDKKNDLNYTEIPKLFKGEKQTKNGKTIEFKANRDTRQRINSYCLKDSDLPLKLKNKIKSIETFVEASRVIGIQINDLIEKGASLRVYALFLKYSNKNGFLVPVNKCKKEEYQGATVIEPKVGFYKDFISCGDFTSLYPSIMIANNLCPSTLILDDMLHLYDENEYQAFEIDIRNKSGYIIKKKKYYFAKKNIHQGIGPIIEIDLLNARKKVRKEIEAAKNQIQYLKTVIDIIEKSEANKLEEHIQKLKEEIEFSKKELETFSKDTKLKKKIEENLKNKLKYIQLFEETEIKNDLKDTYPKKIEELNIKIVILDKRQLSMKVCANSLYGWFAASTNSVSCVPVSETITSFGRSLIEQSKKFVEDNFNIQNGSDFDSEVIYGDTDSIMIRQKYKDKNVQIEKAMNDSKLMVSEVTKYLQKKLNTDVLKMDWEKTYDGFLLLKKKKYAGLKKTEDGQNIDCKGLDNVRRENTKMTKNLINNLFKYIFIEKDLKKAEEEIKVTISNLLLRKISIYDLIQSKKLKSEDQYKVEQIHTILNKKLKKRGLEGYRAGDRINYVVIAGSSFKSKKINSKGKSSSLKDKVTERGEDPLEAFSKKLKIDIDYYLKSQIIDPITRTFSFVIPNIENIFKGEHMRHRADVVPKEFALINFVKKVEKCLCCKENVQNKSNNTSNICDNCKSKGLNKLKYEELKNKLDSINEKQKKSLEICYDCQQHRGDILCTNVNGCSNFWEKELIQDEIEETTLMIEKCGLSF